MAVSAGHECLKEILNLRPWLVPGTQSSGSLRHSNAHWGFGVRTFREWLV